MLVYTKQPAVDASFACGEPLDPAPAVQDTIGCGARPSPVGGPLADGTYYLTSGVQYDHDAGCSEALGIQSQGTIVVNAGEMSIVTTSSDGSGGWGLFDAPDGSPGSGECICGTFTSCGDAGNSGPGGYTSTATTISIVVGNSGLFTFTKQ